MNILTFDIEDWFHTHQDRQNFSGQIWTQLPAKVEENTMLILDMLDELNIKATFFVLGWVAEHHPHLVKKIHRAGHEIGSHSHWHHSACRLVPSDFEKDLVRSMSAISNATGVSVKAYRAPSFSMSANDNHLFEILIRNGIIYDSSVKLNKNTADSPIIINTNNGKIMEFPLITSKIGIPFTGGGYFRVMPEIILNKLFRNNAMNYNLLYFHPREFDKQNPYSNLFGLFRNFLNGYNTKVNMQRLKTILAENPVMTISQAAALINAD